MPDPIPYGRQTVSTADVAAVTEVLRGDWLTTGPAVAAFEERLCEITGARHAVAMSSGTAALHAAAAVAGFGPGDVVATSPLSFAASATCALYVGATPAFVDIDPATYNIDVGAIPPGLAGLVAVHYAGLPVDLEHLSVRPPTIIEDAAHALGAVTPDGPVGSCARSELAVFSFHPVKAVTTAEGGAVTTASDELAAALRSFRSHGTRPTPDAGGWAYDVATLGYNYRLSDLHAALGLAQLERLEEFIQRRNDIAARYRDELADLPVVLPPEAGPGWRHAYHLFAVRVPERRRVYDELHAAGIRVQVHYVPIHHHTLHAPYAAPGELPNVEAVYDGLLSLPIFPGLTDDQQDRVILELRRALRA